MFKILKKSASDISYNPSDDCTTYDLHVGNKIRSYQPKTRPLVQNYINNILFEANMGKFDFNSTFNPVTINWAIQSNTTTLSNSPKPSLSASSIIDPSDERSENDKTKYYNAILPNN